MTGTITLRAPGHPDLELRSIGTDDLENLRGWKNAHRDAFFFKEIITPEGQRKWYQGYLERPDDFMFVICHVGQAIGCIGFRSLGDKIDIYNVIMGTPAMAGKGYMSIALQLMLDEAARRYPDTPLTLMVLKSNPALNWYKKNGFLVSAEHDAYLDLLFTPSAQ